jgi:hypothetical protein
LAKAYVSLGPHGLKASGTSSSLPEQTIHIVADALQKGPDFLEGLTTVLDGRLRLGDLDSAISWARTIKPNLAESTWQEVQVFLQQTRPLTGFT